ncbi:MAG: histidine kinase, partial [Bacteroidetes bacterium]|nr:histidine kinase [Bacteroidota bacterium]
KPQAQLKDINFKVVVELEHKELLFPKNKILQIFGNMISNAIKFTERDGSVEIHLSFEQVTEAKAKLAFSVKDSGVGMTTEQIDLMMNHQAQSTPGTDNERGFGFGFQLSKHLITSMNGTLTIVSEIGKGSEINVKIPVKLYQLKD